MPRYHFLCHACQQTFSKTLTAEEYEEAAVLCPHCGSNEVEQQLAAFYPINWKESA